MFRLPSTLVAAVVEPAWDLYERSERLQTFRRLSRSQWYSADRLHELRRQGLHKLVNHAAVTCPFYTRRFAQAGINPARVWELEDLRQFPVLTKAEVRSHGENMLSSAYDLVDLVHARTGGSTGVALEVYCDGRGVQRRNAAALRADHWAGWHLGQPIAAVWGNPPQPRKWRSRLRRSLKDRIFFLDTMRIDAEAIDGFVSEWRRWRPGLLYGHAHSLYILAEALAERDLTLRPAGVVATSMMLMAKERQVIEDVFDVAVTNRYGCEEVSLIACECEVHQGLHLNEEHVWVEFLNDDGFPCAPGEEGRIVVTELINFGMPMIRYEVGDRGVPTDRKCSCGRGLALMESVTGRTADFLVAADGSRVAGISLIEKTLTALPGIRQLQLVQEKHCQLDANLVPGKDFREDVPHQLDRTLRQFLGEEFAINVKLVQRIPQESSGKYRFSICRVED